MPDDNAWKARINQITDPKELLKKLVDLADSCPVGDPYYADLYEAIIDRAREMIK